MQLNFCINQRKFNADYFSFQTDCFNNLPSQGFVLFNTKVGRHLQINFFLFVMLIFGAKNQHSTKHCLVSQNIFNRFVLSYSFEFTLYIVYLFFFSILIFPLEEDKIYVTVFVHLFIPEIPLLLLFTLFHILFLNKFVYMMNNIFPFHSVYLFIYSCYLSTFISQFNYLR